MKLYISFDTSDFKHALSIAKELSPYASVFKLGVSLLYLYGMQTIQEFKALFPYIPLLIDCKVSENNKELIALFAQAEAGSITTLAGITKQTIHATCIIANNNICQHCLT